MNMNKR